jgi:sulfofructose kinase
MFDVVGLGNSCLDILGVVPHIPGLDEKIEMSNTSLQGGGEVGTALVALAKLGSSAAFIGKVGDDPIGTFIKEDFEKYGVDINNLVVESGAISPSSIVMVEKHSGLRTIIDCGKSVTNLKPEEVQSGLIEKSKYLHLDSWHREAALEAATTARKKGIPVVLDADISAYDAHIAQLIGLTDILITSQSFAQMFTKTDVVNLSIDKMIRLGPSVVMVTLGENGVACEGGGERFMTPAFEVEVVDTTGAGDVFHGAFIHAMLQDWSLQKAVEFASAVSAIKCGMMGGRNGIPTFLETLDFLIEHESKYFSRKY